MSPRNIRVPAASPPRGASAEYPRPRRGAAASAVPLNIHVADPARPRLATAAPPRRASTEYARRYLCVGAEFTWIALYVLHHAPDLALGPLTLRAVTIFFLAPACFLKNFVNIAQFLSAAQNLALRDMEARAERDAEVAKRTRSARKKVR